MTADEWLPARDVLSALLVRRGLPADLANAAADQLLATVEPVGEGGTRPLVLLDYTFTAKEVGGQYRISRDQFERVMSLPGPAPEW